MTDHCPECTAEIIPGSRFCQHCGCKLETEHIQQPTCPACKTIYPPNTRYCDKDGSRLVRPEDLIPRCVQCHTSYPEDVKFCPKDGAEVKVIPPPGNTDRTTDLFSLSGSPRSYPKASIGNRILASLLDGAVTIGLAIPALVFFIVAVNRANDYSTSDAPGIFFLAFVFYLIPLTYNLIKDGFWQGQSVGKRAVDLMVVNLENNTPCSKGKSFFRNFISALGACIPFVGWLIDPIMILATDDGRKLGDKAANTQVIDKDSYY